jgi:cyclopropane fatty-acyl-phospholipid synthase-like methyltransferase
MKINAKKEEYNAKSYFESWHRSSDEFSDRMTISPTFSLLASKYHYNLVENSIIEFIYDKKLSKNLKILDIGSGSGHWIDFYLNVLKADFCMGLDISEPCTIKLREKYLGYENVEIQNKDISLIDFNLTPTFQIINAIGVIFHIVNDSKWKIAIRNLSRSMDRGGFLIVGGEFGTETKDIQFHKIDDFNSWEQRKEAWDNFNNSKSETVLVNKRVRSLKYWVEVSNEYGLEFVDLIKIKKKASIRTPENNILILKKIL